MSGWFLPHHAVYHHPIYDGKLVQVTDVYCAHDKLSATKRRKVHKNKGCCLASIISDKDNDIFSSVEGQTTTATVRKGKVAAVTTTAVGEGRSAEEASFTCVNRANFQSMSPSKRQKTSKALK